MGTPLPLSDVSVVDMGQAIAGPICGTFLADLGADVVKVERPAGDVYRINRRERDGVSFNPPFELYNRNKRSLCLDVKTDEGLEAIYDLVASADVFIQNWPPGVAARLDVSYEDLREHNEDIVYVHVSGYGEDGPAARNPAMDAIIQHVSGFSSLLGYEGDPPIRAQSSVADFYAGYNAALGALAALWGRDRGQGGRKVSISMLDSLMHNMDGAFEYYNNLGEEPPRGGRNGFFSPDMLYGATEAQDGWVAVALLLYSDRVWDGFCELLGNPPELQAEQYETDDGRMADAAKLSAMLQEWVTERTVEQAIEELREVGIPAGRHNSVPDATALDQVAHNQTFTEVNHPRIGELTLTDAPFTFSEASPSIRRHAPMLGQHNRDVLAELGYSQSELDELERQGVLTSE